MREFYKYMAEKAALDASYHYQMFAAHLTGFGVCMLLAVLTYLSSIYPLTIIIGLTSPIFLGFGVWNCIEGSVDEESAAVYRTMGGKYGRSF